MAPNVLMEKIPAWWGTPRLNFTFELFKWHFKRIFLWIELYLVFSYLSSYQNQTNRGIPSPYTLNWTKAKLINYFFFQKIVAIMRNIFFILKFNYIFICEKLCFRYEFLFFDFSLSLIKYSKIVYVITIFHKAEKYLWI